MKIGLISINAHTKVLNFASPLHTYVFQQFLKGNGIESTIIDYKPVYYGKFNTRHPLFYYTNFLVRDPEKYKQLLRKWRKLFYARERRSDLFKAFIKKHYKQTKQCYTAEILDKEDLGFDCYICVTDVIWKINRHKGFDKGFFLACDTMRGKKKIAYAASRGATVYDLEQKKEFLGYISDFDYISTRERSLKDYIDESAGLHVSHVLDPVFLQPQEFYEKLMRRPKRAPVRGFVLLYIVMEKNLDVVKTAVEFAAKRNLDVIELSENLEDANYPPGTKHRVIYGMGVENWLWYLIHADYIFTNSFHACCFSMIFKRQFFAGERSGDKIDSVLEMFGLTWRRVITQEQLASVETMPDIDFAPVEKKIEEQVKYSTDFILGAIHDLEQREHRPLVPEEKLKELYAGVDVEIAEEEARRQAEEERKQAIIEAQKAAEARRREREKARKAAEADAARLAKMSPPLRFAVKARRYVKKKIKKG